MAAQEDVAFLQAQSIHETAEEWAGPKPAHVQLCFCCLLLLLRVLNLHPPSKPYPDEAPVCINCYFILKYALFKIYYPLYFSKASNKNR